ncbi:plasmid mobilization relaxosome protein MobC [Parabacteroides goldsteinii]|uniref:plasmid mobilization relaxosome protein MobC n=1 Tax=Parabacteroides goldsteinii TaxID=328812 RepID=UPI00259BBC8D|nr:plasmid mobilization relaxosome protein MobC [Parabacteroides goldsteinii]
MAEKKRVRDVPLYVWVRPDELEAIRGRMEEAGIRNINGYILHVDLSPVQELVALQRRCANNLNQVATHANSYGVYQEEIKSLQRDYAQLWGPLSDLLQKLSEVVRL